LLCYFSQNLTRVTARARAGGHSTPADQLCRIHDASFANLPRTIRETDELRVYDNSAPGRQPELLLSAQNGSINYLCAQTHHWLEDALHGTEYEITEGLRAAIDRSSDLGR